MRELCTKLIKISPDNGNDHHDCYYIIINNTSYNDQPRGIVVSLTTNHEVPGSISDSTVGILPEGVGFPR